MQSPFLVWCKSYLTCEYHADNPTHGIETFYAFKKKLLEPIKIGWVTFKDSPNMNLNLLPNYAIGNNRVGMVEVGSKGKVLKLFMKRLYDMLIRLGSLKRNDEHHLEKGDHCKFHEAK